MFSTALLPVSFRESVSRLAEMVSFLEIFDTERILLFHVTAGTGTTRSRTRLGEIREQLDSLSGKIALEHHVVSGSPALEISRFAWQHDADFAYFPWKGKNWIQRTLVGSTTQDVIRLSSLPIFVHKTPPAAQSEDDTFRIVYPTTFKETDRLVIPYLQYEGLAADELILLNVRERAPDPEADRRQEERCNTALSRLAESVTGNYSRVIPMGLVGRPRRVIPRVARRRRAHLLVLGKSDQPASLSNVVGSVAESVANNVGCSVFIVGRGHEDGPPTEADRAGRSAQRTGGGS